MRSVRVKPKAGDIRQKIGFAFLPIVIDYGGKKETRWLEQVAVEYTYTKGKYFSGWWEATGFLDIEALRGRY